MQVSSVMRSDPATVTGEVSLDEALRTMDEANVRHLPVVESGRLVGVLSDRDLLAATGGLPARVHACRGPAAADLVPKFVNEVMREPVFHTAPDEMLAPALLRLLQWRIGCLPVLAGEVLIGIVTEMDFVDGYSRITSVAGSATSSGPPLECFMSNAPATIRGEGTLGDAIDLCARLRIRHLPVLGDAGRLGVVSDRDLRRALGSGRELDSPVDKVTTWSPVTSPRGAKLSEAAALMSRHRISSVLVVDNGALVGIVTLTDVLERLLDAAWLGVPPHTSGA